MTAGIFSGIPKSWTAWWILRESRTLRVIKKVSGAKRIHRRERVRTILAIEDFKSPNGKLEDEDLTSEELLLEDPGRSDPGLGRPGLCLHTTASTTTTTTASTTLVPPPLLVPAQLVLTP